MECGFVVLINISSANVVGPVLGGAVYGSLDVQKSFIYMAIFGLNSALLFIGLGWCLIDSGSKDIKMKLKKKTKRRTNNPEMNYLPKTPNMTDTECNPCCWPQI